MQFFRLLAAIFFFACGSSGPIVQVSPLQFDANPVIASSGVCAAQVTLVSISNVTTAVVELIATFTDPSGNQGEFRMGEVELSTATGGSLIVPGKGILQIPLSFDISSKGLDLPVEGDVLILGTGLSSTMQFVGSMKCQV